MQNNIEAISSLCIRESDTSHCSYTRNGLQIALNLYCDRQQDYFLWRIDLAHQLAALDIVMRSLFCIPPFVSDIQEDKH